MKSLFCTIKSVNAKPEVVSGKYVIRDIHDSVEGIVGVCGNVLVGFTFSTNCWFWRGGFYGYLEKSVECVQ